MSDKTMRLVGWIMTGLHALSLLGASATPKLLNMAAATDVMGTLGYPVRHTLMIGVIEVVCVVLFVIPRTALLGAILTTGLLGGAIATQLRADMPLFSHTLFGVYLGVFMWVALWLRDARVRAVFPLRGA